MYKVKKKYCFQEKQKKVAEDIGISEEHLSRIMNGYPCPKTTAYCITIKLDKEARIEDFFNKI